jgi:hypothetical protein
LSLHPSDKSIDDRRRRLVSHRHRPEREIMAARIGAVTVRCPRSNRVGDCKARNLISPTSLPPYARRSKSLRRSVGGNTILACLPYLCSRVDGAWAYVCDCRPKNTRLLELTFGAVEEDSERKSRLVTVAKQLQISASLLQSFSAKFVIWLNR